MKINIINANNFIKIISSVVFIVILFGLTIISNPFAVYGLNSDQSIEFELASTPNEVEMDPGRPVLYIMDRSLGKVSAVNYETGKTTSLLLNSQLDKMVYMNNQLFVTMQNKQASTGAVAVIDTNKMTLKTSFKLDMLPYDIAADPAGYIYITPGVNLMDNGANALESAECLSIENGEKIDISPYPYITSKSLIEKNPTMDKIYLIDPGRLTSRLDKYSTYPQINGLTVFQGKFSQSYIWPNYNGSIYMDKYGILDRTPQLSKVFKLSPDGKYIFNRNGDIFDSDLKYVSSLSRQFIDVAFDSAHHRLFSAVTNGINGIVIYDYEESDNSQKFEPIGFISNDNENRRIDRIFFQNNKLITITMESTNKIRYYVRSFPLISAKILPVFNSVSNFDEQSNFIPSDTSIPTQTGPSNQADEQNQITVEEVYPRNNEEDVPINSPIYIRFNCNVEKGDFSITTSKTSFRDAKFYSSYKGNILRINHDDLDYDSEYTLLFEGGKLKEPFTLKFKTASEYNRLSGSDRYQTSLKISQTGWKQSDYVVLATGEDFPDALSAAPLTQKYKAPILLTLRNQLLPDVETEIRRLQAKKVLIVGGYGAISKEVEEKLEALGLTTRRFAGPDRYETSLLIAQDLDPSAEIFVATGRDYPDALSIASYSAKNGIPILLSEQENLPSGVQDYLRENQVSKAYIIGGEGVIHNSVENQLPNPERIAGIDRYETNLAVLAKYDFDFSKTFLATGQNFPDALSGAPLAAREGSPVLLVSENVSDSIHRAWLFNKSLMKTKCILGGDGVISDTFSINYFYNDFNQGPQMDFLKNDPSNF